MFCKLDNGEILEAPNYVIGPTYELLEELHTSYVYPVDGWYWFETAPLEWPYEVVG